MRVVLFAVLVALGVAGVLAQQPKRVFDVASVRAQTARFPVLSPLSPAAWPQVRPGGRYSGTHSTVAWLIMFAYDLKYHQVVSGPDWIRQTYFDVNAQAQNPDASAEEIRLMVQTLLEERFKLVTRREQRDMRYLAMVLARPSGELGPYLLRVDGECNRETAAEVSKRFPPRAALNRGGMLTGACTELNGLAQGVGELLKVLVIDKTGLSGKFVYDARMGPDLATEASDPALPPLPVALEEQLGLKLQDELGPIDVLVIDSVQQPTEN